MPKSRTIRVTPNLMACLDELKKAVQELPSGERKKRAAAALGYLARTFRGEKQPLLGAGCPRDTLIIK